jgi:hypothetical protein
MRKVEALEKLLLSNFQSSFIPVMNDNVIHLCEDDEINEDAIKSDNQMEEKYSTIERCLKMTQIHKGTT